MGLGQVRWGSYQIDFFSPTKLHFSSSSSSHEAWIISIIGNQTPECCRFPLSEDGESSHSQFAVTRNCQVGPVGQLVVRLLQARVTTVGHPEETQGCTILRTTVPGSSGTQAALLGRSGFWDSISRTFSSAPADGWRACCVRRMLTAGLLWRASSNLLTLHPGCTRPPNGSQSGGNVRFHNRLPSLFSFTKTKCNF